MKKLYSLVMSVLFFSMYINALHITDALRLATKLSKSTTIKPVVPQAKNLVEQLLALQPTAQGIIPVKVLQQGVIPDWPKGNVGNSTITWDQVKAEDGANCGYHALKNVVALMNALKSKQDRFMQDLMTSSFFFDCMKVWVPMIGNRLVDDATIPCVNWLQGDEIEKKLIDRLYALHRVDALENLDIHLAIHVVEWKGTSRLDQVITDNILTSLADVNEKMIGFVWNDSGGHWVGVVLDRSNSHAPKVYYLDSLNLPVISHDRQRKIRDLVMMSPIDARQKLLEYQQRNMSEDLDKMDSDLDILQGRADQGTWIYPVHLGCCQRDNAIVNLRRDKQHVYFDFIPFTKKELEHIDFAKFGIDIDTYLPMLNQLWMHSFGLVIQNKTYPMDYAQALAVPKKRFFDIWYDGQQYTYVLIDQYCHNTNQMLKVVHDKEESYFDPANAIHGGFTKILVNWKNYNDWDDGIVARVSAWLNGVLNYLREHQDIRRAIDWTTFGEVPHQIKFSGGKAVVTLVRQKIDNKGRVAPKSVL